MLYAVGIVVGVAMNLAGVPPVRALFWCAVLNGVLAPPLLVLVLIVANSRPIMGPYVNDLRLNALGWLSAVIMAAAAVALFVT